MPMTILLSIGQVLCDYQLRGGNGFLHGSLASCSSENNMDRNMYFLINMPFAHQFQIFFSEAVPSEDFTSK